jgi:NADPH:quinone reductase
VRAVRFHEFGPPEVLRVEELPEPAAGPDEVLVRVEAAGVNFADTVRRRGEFYPAPTVLPCTTGGEIVGTVEAVGEGGNQALVGTRVVARCEGACAELVATQAQAVFPFPDGMDPVDGVALFVQGLTAALILREAAPLRGGETVFVEGAAGGVGSLAVQLAKLGGAGLVIGGARGEEKQALARGFGADHAVDYRGPGWTERVRELTGGRGVDLYLNMAGAEIFDQCLDTLAWRGRVVVFGSASGTPPRLEVARLFAKCQSVTAFLLFGYLADRELITGTLDDLADLARSGELTVHVGGRFSFEQVADAHRELESGRSVGKLVVLP